MTRGCHGYIKPKLFGRVVVGLPAIDDTRSIMLVNISKYKSRISTGVTALAGKISLLVIMLFTAIRCFAQYEAPYKIANSIEDRNVDSVWVLFPDIHKRSTTFIVSAGLLAKPETLKTGDSVLLDSAYRLILVIDKVELNNQESGTVHAYLPDRSNAKMVLLYRKFGDDWMIGGGTRYEPMACDHLTIGMYSKLELVIGLSFSANCR